MHSVHLCAFIKFTYFGYRVSLVTCDVRETQRCTPPSMAIIRMPIMFSKDLIFSERLRTLHASQHYIPPPLSIASPHAAESQLKECHHVRSMHTASLQAAPKSPDDCTASQTLHSPPPTPIPLSSSSAAAYAQCSCCSRGVPLVDCIVANNFSWQCFASDQDLRSYFRCNNMFTNSTSLIFTSPMYRS